MLLKSSKYHYNVCFPFLFPSPSQVSLTYGFSSCCGGIGFNFAIIFRTLINCSRRIFIFFPRFSPLGWHSQREAHFPSRITGAEFAIPWALITSALFFFFLSQFANPFFHDWETCPSFKPEIVTTNELQWIDIDGSVIVWGPGDGKQCP